MTSFTSLLSIFIGGGLGAVARQVMDASISNKMDWQEAPWGLLCVNLLGCFAIGLMLGWMASSRVQIPWLHPLVITGFLGGFTTFSRYSMQILEMFNMGESKSALLYALASVVFGVLLSWLGYWFTSHQSV